MEIRYGETDHGLLLEGPDWFLHYRGEGSTYLPVKDEHATYIESLRREVARYATVDLPDDLVATLRESGQDPVRQGERLKSCKRQILEEILKYGVSSNAA